MIVSINILGVAISLLREAKSLLDEPAYAAVEAQISEAIKVAEEVLVRVQSEQRSV